MVLMRVHARQGKRNEQGDRVSTSTGGFSKIHQRTGNIKRTVQIVTIPTNHPGFCLIIKEKYCLSHQKIAKSLFFVLTCDASCPYILNGHTAFSSKNTPNQANWTLFKQSFICRLVGMGNQPRSTHVLYYSDVD